MPQSPQGELLGDAQPRQVHEAAIDEFEHLLAEAQALADIERRDEALETCWSARRLAKRHHLERVGEADLTIGRLLLDLDRMNEGLEALYRAVRYFAQRGQLAARGFAEALLAEAAWQRAEGKLAERHLEVAIDLLLTSGDPLGASDLLDDHAERLESAGLEAAANRMRCEARRLGVTAAAS
jgi:tetratricopeptide (TPR) repeat protein